MYTIWFVLGAVGGSLLCWKVNSKGEVQQIRYYGVALVIAALIYVGFSVWSMNSAWILVESLGLVAFGLLAFLGVRYAAIFISIGWLLHPFWDVWLHLSGPGHLIAPVWYAVACVSFDLVVGGWIAFKILR